MSSFKYPVYRPFLGGNEKKYVNECLDSTWISSKGTFIDRFENSFSKYTGIQYSASVSNGTVALHAALLAMGINAGDEVIVPTFTYIASVNAITYTGATPVFVDCLRETWQMDSVDIERKISSKTKAIMVVHLYGHPCDMDRIMKIADKYNLLVVEDCAEGFGSYYKGKHVGQFGHISTFSFFGNKTITCGEGGMVCTNDETLYRRTLSYKGQGLALHREYWHDVIGYNYRMTNIAAAIGLAQLEQADQILEKKRKIAQWYSTELEGLPIQFHKETENTKHSYWMCSILLESSKNREALREKLKNAGIETRPTFFPVHTMPIYSQYFSRNPVSEDLSLRGINLPSYPSLEKDAVSFICKEIRNFISKQPSASISRNETATSVSL